MNRCKRTARLWYNNSFSRFAGANRDRPTPEPPPLAPQKKYILQPPHKVNHGVAAYVLAFVVVFLLIAGTFGAIAAILAGR